MKISIKPALMTACISCALILPQLANANDNGKRKHQGPLSELSLSEEQKVAIKEIGPRAISKKRRKGDLRGIAPIVLSNELDSVQLGLLVDASIAKHKAVGLYALERKFDIQQVLSDEQLAELKANHTGKHNKENNKQNRKKKSLEEKITTKLSLSSEQLASIQPHFDALANLRETAKTERKSFKSFELSLLEQESLDSALWLAQFDLLSSNMKTNKVAVATHIHDIYVLLDSEQQKKLRHQIMKPKSKKKGKGKKKCNV